MEASTYIQTQRSLLESDEDSRFAAQQLLALHEAALARPEVVCLELGTDTGQGTKAMLAACEQNGGRVVSIDVNDCSGAAQSEAWTFVQASSLDRAAIIAKAPLLSEGVDLIYVDSLHTAEHVEREIYTWFDLLKRGGMMFFDDIDSGPYLRGQRKDNASMEIANREIRQLVESVFYANRSQLDLRIMLGSTGLAILTKRSGLGATLAPPLPRRPRQSRLAAKIAKAFGLRRYTYSSGPAT